MLKLFFSFCPRQALMQNATDAMKESRISDLVASLEALDHCEQHARCVYELFERDGNRAIVIEELQEKEEFELLQLVMFAILILVELTELGFGPSIPLHVVLYDWIRHTDGNLDLLYGVSSQIFVKAQ
ncbi:unnamed protein product [Prunus armeniaca]|uniref:Uncharacterized protein n=1 Tax=Prunus armeniaca TaxID=36596 RepID=A0A6J5Y5Q6_PRUAR|nr:unnamed protein product [Prunus armeniaca]